MCATLVRRPGEAAPRRAWDRCIHRCLDPGTPDVGDDRPRRRGVPPLYQHGGSKLIYVVSGRLEHCYGRRHVLLRRGTHLSCWVRLHGPGKLVELPIRMLSVKAVSSEG
jgi:hypothetical protein